MTAETSPGLEPNDEEALRKKLLKRIAAAGVAIIALLGGLAIFETLNRPAPPTMPKMAALPESKEEDDARLAPKDSAASAEQVSEEEKPAEAAKEEASPSAVEESAPAVAVPKPLTPPAAARTTAIRPSETALTPTKPEARREIARLPLLPGGETRQTPLAKAAEASARRLYVQVGVFLDHARAEELADKLKAAGIPVRLETRVTAGPFASQKEIEQARAKLKELGIDEGVLVRR